MRRPSASLESRRQTQLDLKAKFIGRVGHTSISGGDYFFSPLCQARRKAAV